MGFNFIILIFFYSFLFLLILNKNKDSKLIKKYRHIRYREYKITQITKNYIVKLKFNKHAI